jgi:8-oxo-dGTP pyrophosphatase MutT (NUDIX family)
MNDPRDDAATTPADPSAYVWRKLSGETVFETRYHALTRDRLRHPLGHELDYWVIRARREAAGVVPVDAAGRVLLVRQWRHTVEKLLWSIPAGGVEPGEAPADAAARELREETGYDAGRVTPLVRYHPSVGVYAQTYHVFLGEDLSGAGRADPREIVDQRWVERDEVERMIDAGAFEDGFCLTALLMWLRRALSAG